MGQEIQKVLDNIESIKSSLEVISENGIPIIDTFAPTTTVVNIVTTIICTIVGGWITLQLFKKQEKMRIREELRLDFYGQYEILYNTLLNAFIEYEAEYKRVSNFFHYNNGKIENTINGILDVEDVKKDFTCLRKRSIELFEDIEFSLNQLEYFMNSRKSITGYEDFKFENIKIKIGKYKTNFSEISSRHEIINPSLNTKVDETVNIKKIIEGYKNALKKLDLKNGELSSLIDDMQNVHRGIEREYIGQYFEPK